MASPSALREGIATRLRGITGLNVYERWPSGGGLNVPCAVVLPGPAEPEQTFGRGDLTRWEFSVNLFVSLAPGVEQAQRNLDPYLATSSTGGVYGAIHGDRTLGGAAHGTFVRGWRDYDQREEAPEYLGVVVDLEVWAS